MRAQRAGQRVIGLNHHIGHQALGAAFIWRRTHQWRAQQAHYRARGCATPRIVTTVVLAAMANSRFRCPWIRGLASMFGLDPMVVRSTAKLAERSIILVRPH
ncbi:hypothetical protein DFQ28_010414 [Apophysomyces sp. BC1034]|nr:hypothetical protein DFQ30_000972 [Apophysomyces sp. BC1015]KAG0192029.1 hypothetical protein DFQ28_010414 [Apophysomyces sp. BC1034]